MGRFAGLFAKAKKAATHMVRGLPPEELMYADTRKSKKGWRWVVVSGNGVIIVDSRNYYTRESDAKRAYDRFLVTAPAPFRAIAAQPGL